MTKRKKMSIELQGKMTEAYMEEPPPPRPVHEIDDKLVYAVIRRYKGEGEPVLILHEAKVEPTGGFSYGVGKTWVLPLPPKEVQ
jgi:hypothetical protein